MQRSGGSVYNRQSVVALADVKSKQAAPVYVDWFTWQPPLFDNRMRAFHCVDICFWFYNTDLMLTHTGGGPRPNLERVAKGRTSLRKGRIHVPRGVRETEAGV